MATRPAEDLPFDEDNLAPVVERMATRAAAGTGWINFLPETPPDAPVPRTAFYTSIFTAKGPAVPMATWKPAALNRNDRMTVGIEHGSGPKALARLAERQLTPPAGWRKVADHPKRGLVLNAPADEPVDDVLWWLLAASHALAPIGLTGDWLARIYNG